MTAIKSLAEMSTPELTTLKATCGEMISHLITNLLPAADLIRFERAIDDELIARGA